METMCVSYKNLLSNLLAKLKFNILILFDMIL